MQQNTRAKNEQGEILFMVFLVAFSGDSAAQFDSVLNRWLRRQHSHRRVTAIVKAPQKLTRAAPLTTLAPPVCAANPPRAAKNIKDAPETRNIRRSLQPYKRDL